MSSIGPRLSVATRMSGWSQPAWRVARPPDEAAIGFLAFVASMPYDGAQRAQAEQWVRENTRSGGKLELGTANLELSKEENAHVLSIVSRGS